ncbi:hypothetical protein B0A50_05207 [Salinomyces thailandicus]|uniref:RRM domain-containing protein n=1 Tax=Salinomyces thailandicus TaxID=706561 RepID=A0A4U0TYA1_9PEZI|nr:hypothetical protein B0A50_05207 [Salinomyces thailandica]
MSSREKGGRVVFIGNIPYGVSEEQICDIFGRVGQVVNFRLVYDKESGRPKGFGFLEYTDVDAAASAVRNLEGHEIMGRTLRVDYSNDNGGGKSGGGGGGTGNQGGSGGGATQMQMPQQPAYGAMDGMGYNGAPPQQDGALPNLPPGVDLPPGLTAPDAISQTLATLPVPQLLDILSQMKNVASVNPAQASTLLAQAPQLSYAIFQALLLLGLVDTNILGSLVQQTSSAPPPQQQPQPPPPQQQFQPPSQGMPPVPMGMPPGYPPPPQFQPQSFPPQPQQSYTPIQHQPAYQPPPQAQQAPQPATQMPADPAQAAVIQQILAMSHEQVMGLEPSQRDQVNTLRRQFGAPAY